MKDNIKSIKKLSKLDANQQRYYDKQTNVSRGKEQSGGYEYVIYATDQDLD